MSLKKQLTILPDLSRVLPNLLRCPRELRAVRIRDPRSARCQCPCRWMRMTSISASKIMHWSVRSTFRRGRSEVPIGLLLRCTVSCARLMIESLGSAKLTFGPGAGLGLALSTMTARIGPGANRCPLFLENFALLSESECKPFLSGLMEVMGPSCRLDVPRLLGQQIMKYLLPLIHLVPYSIMTTSRNVVPSQDIRHRQHSSQPRSWICEAKEERRLQLLSLTTGLGCPGLWKTQC